MDNSTHFAFLPPQRPPNHVPAAMPNEAESIKKKLYLKTRYSSVAAGLHFVIFWYFFSAHFVFSWFEGQNVIFQHGINNFWIQQVQITLKTLVAKNEQQMP